MMLGAHNRLLCFYYGWFVQEMTRRGDPQVRIKTELMRHVFFTATPAQLRKIAAVLGVDSQHV